MAAGRRRHIFLICLLHPECGPLVGWLKVSAKPAGLWRTDWDIGSIDRDSRLSDHWFFREKYQNRFEEVLRAMAHKTIGFELPGATSRWGMAGNMPRKHALELAGQILALWQEILLDWENGGRIREGARR